MAGKNMPRLAHTGRFREVKGQGYRGQVSGCRGHGLGYMCQEVKGVKDIWVRV